LVGFDGRDAWSPAFPGPIYGPASVLIFSSPHWKRMPTVWPTKNYVKDRIDENLRVNRSLQWWRTHNTWNQQFFDQPARLLPDLAIQAGSLRASPALGVVGNVTTLTAQIQNLGGRPASNIKVSFYDGDPQAGGKLIGDTVVAGPLAARTARTIASALASLTW